MVAATRSCRTGTILCLGVSSEMRRKVVKLGCLYVGGVDVAAGARQGGDSAHSHPPKSWIFSPKTSVRGGFHWLGVSSKIGKISYMSSDGLEK